MIISLIAGNTLEPPHHNVSRKAKRDGLRSGRIGQSAAKTLRKAVKPAMRNVQRLSGSGVESSDSKQETPQGG